jgi:hypothetical protein
LFDNASTPTTKEGKQSVKDRNQVIGAELIPETVLLLVKYQLLYVNKSRFVFLKQETFWDNAML